MRGITSQTTRKLEIHKTHLPYERGPESIRPFSDGFSYTDDLLLLILKEDIFWGKIYRLMTQNFLNLIIEMILKVLNLSLLTLDSHFILMSYTISCISQFVDILH